MKKGIVILLIIILLAIGTTWYFTNRKKKGKTAATAGNAPALSNGVISPTDNKRVALEQWSSTIGEPFNGLTYNMTNEEVGYVYDFVFNYLQKNRKPDPDSELRYAIESIGMKYNIFT